MVKISFYIPKRVRLFVKQIAIPKCGNDRIENQGFPTNHLFKAKQYFVNLP